MRIGLTTIGDCFLCGHGRTSRPWSRTCDRRRARSRRPTCPRPNGLHRPHSRGSKARPARLIREAQENQAAAGHAIGLTLLTVAKLDAASEQLEQALAIRRQLVVENPDRLDYQFDLAATMAGLAEHDRRAGRDQRAKAWWGKALPILAQAAERRPADRLAWQLLGLAQAGLGQTKEAAAAFARLMELVPPTRYKGLWWYPDPAAIGEILAPYDEIFARVVQMRPRDRTLLIARFHYFGRRRRWREAADIVARILELDPYDIQARHYHRILLYHCGDFGGYQREMHRELMSLGRPVPFQGSACESRVLWLPPGPDRWRSNPTGNASTPRRYTIAESSLRRAITPSY